MALEAGRKLDALIAEKVMGIAVAYDQVMMGLRALIGDKRADDPWEYFIGNTNTRIPKYSTDMTAAWLVVEKMREHPDAGRRTLTLRAYPYARTYAVFGDWEDDGLWVEANGEHATELAICLAALKVAA